MQTEIKNGHYPTDHAGAREYLLNGDDRDLIQAAEAALDRAFRPEQHTVGCAVRAGSGKIYAGVNIKACGYGPCAEPIAAGAAFTAGEQEIVAIVAVRRYDKGQGYRIVSPCGNCRQLLVDYSPEAVVIYSDGSGPRKARVAELLPGYYVTRWNERLAGPVELAPAERGRVLRKKKA